jgi:hypothetical protein
MRLLTLILMTLTMAMACAAEVEPDKYYKHASPKVERDDPAYLRWKAAWTEYAKVKAQYRELCSKDQQYSYEAKKLGSYVPDGYSDSPPPEGLLTDSKGNISMKGNAMTYFVWPILIAIVALLLLKSGGGGGILLGIGGMVGLFLYVCHVSDQYGGVGFVVWFLGFFLLCSVLRFIKFMLVGS